METLKTALLTLLCLGQLAVIVWIGVWYYVNFGVLP